MARTLPWGRGRLLPLGDDAAAIPAPNGRAVVVSTDALVERYHFLRGSPPARVGGAAVSVGLSDIASKGARPAGALLAITAPPGTPESWAREVVRGAEACAARFGAHVIGGDTKAGAARSVVGTVVGWGRPEELVARSGARPGELLVTTGSVGRGGAASIGLAAGGAARTRAAAEMLDVVPRVREGPALARFATSMLDTSDGLAESSRLLAAASRVRVEVDEARIPWHPRLVRLAPGPRRRLGFYGGDYELLATVRRADANAAIRRLARLGTRLTVVGEVRPGRGAFLRRGRELVPMPASGWQPLA